MTTVVVLSVCLFEKAAHWGHLCNQLIFCNKTSYYKTQFILYQPYKCGCISDKVNFLQWQLQRSVFSVTGSLILQGLLSYF